MTSTLPTQAYVRSYKILPVVLVDELVAHVCPKNALLLHRGRKGRESACPPSLRFCERVAGVEGRRAKKRKKIVFPRDETRAECEQMASRSVNVPKSCNFSTLR